MTYQKMKPCLDCGKTDMLDVFTYHNGWSHVECVRCNYLGPGEGRIGQAIKSHNTRWIEAQKETPRLVGERCNDIGVDNPNIYGRLAR